MGDFDADVRALVKSDISRAVNDRLLEFGSLFNATEREWFSELCFCLLTANAKQKTAAAVQAELGFEGFSASSQEMLVECLVRNKHRFHNNKARWIVLARSHAPVRQWILNELKAGSARRARDALAGRVKGLGMKEASHFLRNVGVLDVAIIDRHILRVLKRYGLIRSIPTSITPRKYRYLEGRLQRIAKSHRMSLGELDLYMWYMNTGTVLK